MSNINLVAEFAKISALKLSRAGKKQNAATVFFRFYKTLKTHVHVFNVINVVYKFG